MTCFSGKLSLATGQWRERRGPYLISRVGDKEAEDLLEALLPDPERLFQKGAALQSPWQTKATDKVVACVQGRSYFLKRYNCVGWIYRLKNAFRKSRGEKSWEAAWLFHRLGVSTPLPLLWIEERRQRLLGISILAFPHLQSSVSLLDFWPEAQPDRQLQVLERAASIIGKMHRAGILHGDLNWRNLLVEKSEGKLDVMLVDLDGYRINRTQKLKEAEDDLFHFVRDLQRSGGDESQRDCFLQKWRSNFYSSN